ncbi:hypothetical protein HNQ88_005199 [Aureibacter tunicatorum]|uniref:Uncharacterized protein n=1 Tax=Aureibacter tunicatorum TaxID=866807 RepID=A0AAE3XS15_9BACT|nr:hypothetical protein [Aureibacter tunicatorum]BDD05634.1 hypothetical protein AUTU_31170 [Aureibacter tunicatorum]
MFLFLGYCKSVFLLLINYVVAFGVLLRIILEC